SIRWKKVETVLLTPTGHPLEGIKNVSIRDITQYPLIMPPKSVDYLNRRNLEEVFRKYNLSYRIVIESSNIELSSLYVEMGLGITFATVVKDLSIFKKRGLAVIPLDR
ncbi:MAG: LysR family transcriptional regulator substrate-binding protein, partial [Desulfocucumaceae bacterium]